MLSRVAEALYWTGRYVERAEDTARLLDVHVHAVLEDPWVDAERTCRDLLQVMGLESDTACDVGATTRLLAYEPGSGSSIVGAIAGARESARGAREALSSELWECLNATHLALPAEVARARRHGPHGFFRYVRERTALVTGLLDGTMPRDDGWRFLVLGRSLERVDMTARLLWACARHGSPSSWVTLLRSCSAHEAYLRTYRAAIDPARVVEFLLVDRLFPRSVYVALAQAELCLQELDPQHDRAGVGDEARRLLGRARTELEFLDPDVVAADLIPLLERVQGTCAEAGTAVARRYFARGSALSWAVEAGA